MENAEELGFSERVQFLETSWTDGVAGHFDGILSNPPYLTEDEWKSSRPEVRDHDPREALVADESGLADLRAILRSAPDLLTDGGWILLETGLHHPDRLVKEERGKWSKVEGFRALDGRPRFFFAQR